MLTREDLREIRSIEIRTRRLVQDQLAGSYHSVFKGRGMSFDSVRVYQPGDDIRRIDWNVSARTSDVHVKEFVEERELTVMILVDMSASLDFGTRVESKRRVAAKLAALLAFSAIENNDRVGLVLFTEEVERYIPPKKGRKHVLRLLSEIMAYQPTHAGTNVDASMEFLLRVARRKAVAFLVSDFKDEGPRRALRIAAGRHDLIPILLEDPLESALPDLGMAWMEDAETGEILPVPTHMEGFRRRFEAEASSARESLEALFRRLKIDAIRLQTGEPLHRPLLNYFKLRAKRA